MICFPFAIVPDFRIDNLLLSQFTLSSPPPVRFLVIPLPFFMLFFVLFLYGVLPKSFYTVRCVGNPKISTLIMSGSFPKCRPEIPENIIG
jgi:hypothetical protein